MTTNDNDTKTLKELRETSEAAEETARVAKSALLERAVKDAMKSTKYGHLSGVAREAGIAAQYLRDLIEKEHPGWLDQAAEEREAAKAAAPRGRKAARAA
ncbi:hypothetical protein [Streptomyces sp. NPDC048341]|uniref:hypothetical protein n=1 Tax=Streptomyces sp. NPDC048341 TaxID=3154620 RepID=UPI0034367CF1